MNTDDHNQPTPEKLAAYVDGELTPTERASVEHWLAENPDRRAELSGHRQLGQLWQSTRPTEPDDETWTAAFAGISDRLPAPAVVHAGRRVPLRLLAGIAAAAAAVALIWILAGRKGPPEPAPLPERELAETPYPAASADDVVITSLVGGEEEVVLVGYPPLREPMKLAAPGDVHMEERNPVKNATIEYNEEPGAPPMIIIQPDTAKENE